MKKLYNSPELEIVKFTAMEAMAADELQPSSGDIYDTIPGDNEV